MFLSTAPRAEADDRSPYGNFFFEPVGIRATSGMRVTSTSAMALPAVYACVQVLAKSFALMPFCLYEPQEGKGRLKRRDHWLYRLLAKAPNRFQSPFEWRMMLMGHLALRGNAFCQIVGNGRGEIVELLPLHPDRMRVEVLPSGNYRYLYTDMQGREIPFMRGEIWHLRGMSSDGFVGLSPIEVARDVIGEGLAMQSYASRFYVNDARPGGWVEFDGKFSSETAKADWRKSWQANYSGANARKVAVLEKGMKYHELKLNNSDAQFVEGRAGNLADIARIWGIPPHKIQDLSRSTLNNIEHQSIEFWTDVMLPWAELWESSIEFFLLGTDETPELEPEFDMSRLMRGDSKARSERIKNLVLGGVMKPNEGRDEEGYDPAPGGDKLLRPLNMVALDEEGNPEPLPKGADHGTPGEPANGAGGANGADARMNALLRGNANRMARRIAGGSTPSADVLGESMAVSTAAAAEWLQVTRKEAEIDGLDESALCESLMSMALGNKPNPMGVGASAMNRLATTLAKMPAPVANVVNHVAPAAVTVQAAQVNVPATVVNLPATEIVNNITTPKPEVHVDVAAPVVHNHVTAAEQPAPVVHNHVTAAAAPAQVKVVAAPAQPSSGGQAPRPWPTMTVIKTRDNMGRADEIETRPIDD